MNLKSFVDIINKYADDIGCMKDGNIGSHNIVASLNIEDDNDNYYELIDINIEYLGGCGCPSDITLKIRLEETQMTIIQKLLAIIETKNSWGKNELKMEILKLLAEDYKEK